eukprot:CAMPEP_0178488594 /NCGR_PEP_ID=MMETSP0696-20121128/9940_1 /TAXON_ID=265572 /ORGANISM="Extubocellulus spinifer, Strain CCMP396" /LENGTH=1177 /DNA_ID=CAMNT_0020116367 /DNA_START=521 /DNA_END=4055 /DNA_ORIENTATION=+
MVPPTVEEAFDAEANEASLYQSTYVTSNESDHYDFYHNYDPTDPSCEDQYAHAMDEYYEKVVAASEDSAARPLVWEYDDEGKDVKVTFNESKTTIWSKAQEELNHIRENCKEKAGIEDISDYEPVRDSIKLFFGKQKALGELLQSTLGLSRDKTLQFIATYCFQKQHGKSVKNMYDRDSGLDTSGIGLMSKEEYMACWRIIDVAGDSPGSKRRGAVPFWQKFQDRLNEAFVELYMGFDGDMLIALDDDKRNAELKSDRNQQGLKATVHDAKKRAGVVGHTAVSVYSMITLAVMWERSGETQYDCYMRCVQSMFGTHCRLDRVTFASDRGYWIRRLMEKLVELGADIEGTWKRCLTMPFTYDQNLTENDMRRLMSTEGPMSLHRATTKVHGKTVAANYSTSGTGKGVLTASTVHTEQHIEVVVDDAKRVSTSIDAAATDAQRRARTFRHVGTNCAPDDASQVNMIDRELGGLPIDHTVEYQGQPTWFVGRQNSITSSGAARHFPILFRNHREGEDIHPHVSDIEEYLAVASEAGNGDRTFGLDAITDPVVNGDGDGDDDDEELGDDVAEDEGGDGGDEDDPAGSYGKEIVDQLSADEEFSSSFLESAKERDVAELKSVVVAMGGSARKSKNANIKSIKTWIDTRPCARPYILLSKSELQDLYKTKLGISPRKSLGVKDLIARLAGEVEPEQPIIAASTYIDAVVMTNHMPPLRGEAKRHAAVGTKMEPEYAKDLLSLTNGGVRIGQRKLEVLHLFRSGLVQSRGRSYQKDSPDYVAIIKLDERTCVAAVEMKCRCANTTASKERDRISKDGKLVHADSRSRELRRHVQSRSEALQCLHHAATLGVDHVIFVVGDTVGLTGGVLIEYDAPLRQSYNKCVDDIYETGLKWAYDTSVPIPTEEIKAAVGKARVKMDYCSFMKSVYVWQEMLQPSNLPLPPAIRIIPMQSQYWNDSKYGSDVKTQAAEDHRAILPVESRQAKVFDRMMMLILSDVHSLAKLFSAKQDLSSYPDLQHYRDAGDHRYSMEQVLIDSRKALLAMMSGRNMDVESNTGDVSFGTSNESRITRNQAVKNVDMLRYTGTTPKQKNKVLKRYRDSYSDDDECAKRFKECIGRPIERVGVNLNNRASGEGALVLDAVHGPIGGVLSATLGRAMTGAILRMESPTLYVISKTTGHMWQAEG